MQSPAVLVTSRRVQNVHTGLDLTVPQHQEVRGKMMSGHVEYQILVVTRLAAFKSAKHRPEDVVQFLVSKKYSEIEEFYQKLSSRYPTSSLPPLPKKVLFVGESDIRERRAVFNEILRCVSKDAELAGSPELLEFLGTRSPGAADLTSRDVSVLDAHSQAQDDGEAFDFFEQQDRAEAEGLPISGRKGEDARNSSEEEEEEALDPLGIMRSKKSKKRPEVAVKPKPSPRLTIFDEEVDPDEGLFGPSTKLSPQRPAEDVPLQDPLKLFEDPDLGGAVPLGDPLLLPAAGESGGPVSHAELFRVEEDLDQLLNLGAEPTPKPQPECKVPVAARPALPRKPAVPPRVGLSEAVAGQRKQQQIQAMDEMDILQYIRDHDAPGRADPSLF
ncbi:HCLS1-binding protein 3-like isoform X1 [Phoca vitulina]|uniref:HCLS1-binding protein 3-like isoform X1 n=1 Tax=Phoca vitulina TaxID=9720 RepID=UPI0013961BA2|nr:HCLS1-binding protein 3-like isoform X1 [Phoca vitulina]XP_032255163.1 HCLS1-binding protein 3-like isoform X1 [Phoca vitulina]